MAVWVAIRRAVVLWVGLSTLPGSLSAQSYGEFQKAYDETTVIEKTGSAIPLQSRFMGLDGIWYSLKELFANDRPVFLSLNYANCPQLCQNQLKMLAERFSEAKMVAGRDFDFISISIDPREAQLKTRQAQEAFCRLMGGKSNLPGVHFLVGKKTDIDLVADSIGFVYTYLPAANHYSHAPVCVSVSPEGKISRYIHGLAFTAKDLDESRKIAGEGRVSQESIASFVYRCLIFGANPGQYTGSLMGLMRIAGGATVIVLAACVVPFWLRSQRRVKEDKEKETVTELNNHLETIQNSHS
jgi:protein SCO1/2